MLKNPIFIHGWAFSSRIFDKFSGVKYDLPGHGGNRNNYSGIDRILHEIFSLTSTKHDIVGWSLGGSLALLFAYKFPYKVNRIFLIGTTPFFKGAWEEKNVRAMKLLIKKGGIKAFRKLAYGDFEDFFEEKNGMKLLEDYINLNLYPILSCIRQEVYILHGVEDKIVPPKEAFRLHKFLRCSKLILLGGGHFPIRDEEHFKSSVLKSC